MLKTRRRRLVSLSALLVLWLYSSVQRFNRGGMPLFDRRRTKKDCYYDKTVLRSLVTVYQLKSQRKRSKELLELSARVGTSNQLAGVSSNARPSR